MVSNINKAKNTWTLIKRISKPNNWVQTSKLKSFDSNFQNVWIGKLSARIFPNSKVRTTKYKQNICDVAMLPNSDFFLVFYFDISHRHQHHCFSYLYGWALPLPLYCSSTSPMLLLKYIKHTDSNLENNDSMCSTKSLQIRITTRLIACVAI